MVTALESPGDPLDRHFAMMAVVKQAYVARGMDASMRDLAVSMGRRHVAEFETMKAALRKDIGFLPRVPTFEWLATCLTELGQYEEAIAVCRRAIDFGLDDGTMGGYRGRIERVRKAMSPPAAAKRPRKQRRIAAPAKEDPPSPPPTNPAPDGVNVVELRLERVNNAPGGKALYRIGDGAVFAEDAALDHYRSLGFQAIWSENDYWWMLMSLLFWDVIFAKVAGAVAVSGDPLEEMPVSDPRFDDLFAWTVAANGMPADLFTRSFFQRRASLIEERVQHLLRADLGRELQASYGHHFETRCRPIENWKKFSLQDLTLAVERLAPLMLLQILHRLLQDFSSNRSGLPDLIVVGPDGLRFAEVKSENDKVSPGQHRWHEFLVRTLGLRVDLCLINPRP